jgi:hypothetical protein
MGMNSVINLYIKERKYEEETFGNYTNNESLNLASFITFLETYVIRAKKTYTQKWVEERPAWMLSSKEEMLNGSTPVETYECLIKIMALAGAALESYIEINPEKWREKE